MLGPQCYEDSFLQRSKPHSSSSSSSSTLQRSNSHTSSIEGNEYGDAGPTKSTLSLSSNSAARDDAKTNGFNWRVDSSSVGSVDKSAKLGSRKNDGLIDIY